VVYPDASLPEICVGCGGASWGNVTRKEFSRPSQLVYLPASGIGFFFALIFGKAYVFDFPFCTNCPPDAFQLKVKFVDGGFAVFSGAPRRLLQALPPVTDQMASEMSLNWFQRSFRWLWM
jgi:hypothetical protein